MRASSWAREASDEQITAVVGPASMARGRQYADSGAIQTLIERADGQVLLGTVSGSGRSLYQTIVEVFEPHPRHLFTGRCSCPMSYNCKHVAAVVIAARNAAIERTPIADWEETLRPLVGTPVPQDAVDLPIAAFEVSLVSGQPRSRGATAERVELRPLKQGRTKRWVRTGASWTDLGSPWGRGGVRPDHQGLIADVLTLFRGTASGQHYGFSNVTVHLDDLGPGVWPLLRRAAALGMPLVAGSDIASVSLHEEQARLALDVTRQEDGGLVVTAQILLHDDHLDGTVVVLGSPAHGVAVLDDQGVLHLAALADAPAETLATVVAANRPIRVPAADTQRFLDLYYPVLSRQVSVGSSDDSVTLAEAVPPRLELIVTFDEGHRCSLAWGFVYGATDEQATDEQATNDHAADSGPASRGTRVGLDFAVYDPPRDLETEQALLASLIELQRMPALQHRAASGALHPVAAITLTGVSTATFAADVLPLLRQRSDVIVTVTGEPAAYVEADTAPVVHLKTTDGPDGGQQSDWFDLQVTVSIAGEHVPFAPLFSALTAGEDVMLLDSGTWFTLDRPELQSLRTLIDEARELSDPGSDTLRVTRYQVSLWEELMALGVVDEQSERWSRAVGGMRGLGQAEPPQVPAALAATLRPYQQEGFAWLCALWDGGLGGVLADDMGLGKTVQVLALLVRAQQRSQLEQPILVVAPTSVVGTWVDEAAKFAPDLVVVPITSTQKRRGKSIEAAATGAHVVVTSYTLLRLEDTAYRDVAWSGVVLDEAQFVKNHRSKTYSAVRRLGAPFTLAVTGTPLENSLMDLWSMLSLAAPGLFPKPEVFAQRYRKPIESGEAPEQLAILRRRIRPFMLRRTKADVAPELPPKQEQTLHIELSAAHRRIYQQHLQRERQRVLGLLEDMDRNRVAIFRALTALRQMALDPSLVDQAYAGKATSAKIDALLEQVQELAAEGHRALVFSSFTGFLALVRARLDEAGIGYSYLDGRTRNRPERIKGFREGNDPVFLISLKAGGFGLTLTEADYVFVLDPWWNPAAESQAIDRTHRIGQTRSVMVYRMVSADTIEDKVVALQDRKRELFATVIDDGEFSSGAMTPDDIRSLLEA